MDINEDYFVKLLTNVVLYFIIKLNFIKLRIGKFLMDNVIADRIADVHLTRGQKKIADYCIRYPEEVGMCSSMELSRRVGVSDASITRFARAIGYEGFVELKNDLYSHMAMAATGNINSLAMMDRYDLLRDRFPGQMEPEEFYKITKANIERTLQQCKPGQLNAVAEILLAANHHYVYGCRGTAGIAKQGVWLFGFMLEHVTGIYNGGMDDIAALYDISAGDCLLIFSVSRYYKIDLSAAELAKRHGAKICLITDSLLSPLVPLADEVIRVETQHRSFFNSMNAMNFVVEYLAYLISQRRGDAYRCRAKERDELSDFLRLEK